MTDTGTHSCRAKVGLLFLRDCDRPARADCARCGRPVCGEHAVRDEKGTLCPECSTENRRLADRPAAQSVVRRRRYYGGAHYHPIYFGHHHYYSDDDFRAFDGREMIQEEHDGEWDDADAGGADDYLES